MGCFNLRQVNLEGKIVYESIEENEGYGGLHFYDIETGNIEQLTDGAYYDFNPEISLDGKRMIFVSSRDGDHELYFLEIESGRIQKLTENDYYDNHPKFTNDGEKIVFLSERNGIYQIFSMNVNGSGQTQLTFDDGGGSNPIWSPDGQLILFSSSQNSKQESMLGNNELFLINQDGSDLIQITDYETNTLRPSWSPDGQFILFESDREAIRGHVLKLYLLDLETGETKRFVNIDLNGYPELLEYPESREMVSEYGASWSPDGRWVAFTMMDNIYITDVAGTVLMNVIENGIYPSWGN